MLQDKVVLLCLVDFESYDFKVGDASLLCKQDKAVLLCFINGEYFDWVLC